MNKIYAVKTKGRYKGKRVLVAESVIPYDKSKISKLRDRLIFNSLEFDRNLKLEIS